MKGAMKAPFKCLWNNQNCQ